jgi:arylsulfatase A-like enzyme
MEECLLRYSARVTLGLGLCLLGFASAALSAHKAGRAAPKPPNFIIFLADDMSWGDCRPEGKAAAKTPVLAALAGQGMRFDRAFLTCSSCSATRASLLTGRYPHSTGAAELHQGVPNEQTIVTELLRKNGYFTAAAGRWHQGPATKAKFDLVKEGGGPGGYADWVPLLRDRPAGRPFFLWLASTDPHRPFPPQTGQPHKPQDVEVPPYLPDCAEVRAGLARYYDAIERLDANVGKVLDELSRQGETKNTVVIFLSDGGRPFPRCKNTLYDSGLRIPLCVRWPLGVTAGATCHSLVSAVDLAPTILEVAGAAPLSGSQGKSFAALLSNPQLKIRDYAFAEHNWQDYQAFERGVRTQQYSYIRNEVPELPATPPAEVVRGESYQAMRRLREQGKLGPAQMACFLRPRPREELYDLAHDPYELKNVADDPRHSEALQDLRQVLSTWRSETGDAKPESLTPDKYDRETGLGISVGARLATKRAESGR